MEPIDVSIPDASDCITPLTTKNGLRLYPVPSGDSGDGLPYAPVDWPNPGDIWRWRAGKRVRTNGYYQDRYLYAPKHLVKRDVLLKKYPFASKLAVEEYVRLIVPGADMNAFFDSFSWDIPSQQLSNKIGHKGHRMSSGKAAGNSDSAPLSSLTCKAGNRTCSSLAKAGSTPSKFMSCNICCSEQGFCKYCCCILCCKTASSDYGGYCYIRCEQTFDEGYICGHIAHVDCGLRARVAGTVGGNIGLDAEYYCTRCDSKTDLVQHVRKLVDISQTINSHDNIKNILNVCICLLRNSHRPSAQQLFHNIQDAIVKLKRGTKLEDIWSELNAGVPLATAGSPSNNGVNALRLGSKEEHTNTKTEEQMVFDLKSDSHMDSFMLEDEVDLVLENLRKSQQSEYRLAEERLLAQKNHIQRLYEQLDKEGSDLSMNASQVDLESLRNASHEDLESLIDAVLERVDQIKGELNKFNNMKEVAKGFGRTSQQVLKDHFSVEPE